MKGDTVYIWQVFEAGEWGAIMGEAIPGMGPTVLVSRDLQTAQLLGLFAVAHHDSTGLPVRCARFDNPTIVRTIP